ncbi:MAG: ATP-dependent ligase [Pseudonocardiales bacterium]|nr:ATP-dependent ligase [Pseudonocardiales bacterium]
MPTLPSSGLEGPVELALARSEETVPTSNMLPGGCRYELKWDGYRIAIVRLSYGARLWSRQGNDLTAIFPDLAAAADFHLKPGTVLDGEAVIWHDGRLRFDLLQKRMAHRHQPRADTIKAHPASYVAFDLLATADRDWRPTRFSTRRSELERLAARWAPPLQVSPVTGDHDEAMGWFVDYRPAGIEGLVIKAADGRYLPGRRDWVKVKNRETREVVVGAVIGPIHAPTAVIAGQMRDGELLIAGRSTELTSSQSTQLAEVLTAADTKHPWPEHIGAGVFGARRTLAITRVAPTVVIEVSADAAVQAGRYRHALRYLRIRSDLTPADVEPSMADDAED